MSDIDFHSVEKEKKNTKIEMIPTTLKNLLAKLEFLSMIERGQKPCFTDMSIVLSNSWIGAWKRLTMGENRKNLLFELNEIIEQCILAIDEYYSTPYFSILLENLAKAKAGIENLIITYHDNPNTASKLRIFVIHIELILKKFSSPK